MTARTLQLSPDECRFLALVARRVREDRVSIRMIDASATMLRWAGPAPVGVLAADRATLLAAASNLAALRETAKAWPEPDA